jgi:DNA topoisomerase-1
LANRTYWNTLRHNGPAFPEPYKAHGLNIYVNGVKIPLSPDSEEMAYNLAKKKDTPYIKDRVFTSNFMRDFRRTLPDRFQDLKFEQVDFSEFFSFVDEEKRRKEMKSKEERKLEAQRRRENKERLRQEHGFAYLDGEKIEVANWMIEPPGLFMGRGSHPLRGRWKRRVEKGDVELNLGENEPVPKGTWKSVLHDHNSMWLARWTDGLTGKMKYVWPHESSTILQDKNREKYDKAMRLRTQLGKIRSKIRQGMASKDIKVRKVATVCYLIDSLGMRVGDEKDEDEADTVGATTLRVEHIRIHPRSVRFDFLGKDSVRWEKEIPNPEERLVLNLKEFMRSKKQTDLVFDGITSRMVNSFLSKVSRDVTAKTFRTFHATAVAEAYLASHQKRAAELNDEAKLYYAKLANLEAAKLCNHKRTPPKNWEESLMKKKLLLEELRRRNPRNERERQTVSRRLEKLKLSLDLAMKTRDYNLNTSLKNYIDPRLYKAWCNSVGLDWRKLYTKALQRKFAWVSRSRVRWNSPRSIVLEVAQPRHFRL